jgi:hypothetical protein
MGFHRGRSLLGLVLALMTAPPAWAHALGAECKVRGDQLEIEAYFDDDTPAERARVRILDNDGREVATGRTDDKGVFRLATPAAGRYRVVVDAGSGHRAQVTVTIASNTSSPVTVSEGPTREEFTRMPWFYVGLGLLLIAGITSGWLWFRRHTTAQPDQVP